ncbi:MAG: hypothetical protein AAB638_00845 [Patescibacteria group bacterium]
MRSIQLLKVIISLPNIFSNEAQRQVAKDNLFKKINRRDRKIKKETQLTLPLNQEADLGKLEKDYRWLMNRQVTKDITLPLNQEADLKKLENGYQWLINRK